MGRRGVGQVDRVPVEGRPPSARGARLGGRRGAGGCAHRQAWSAKAAEVCWSRCSPSETPLLDLARGERRQRAALQAITRMSAIGCYAPDGGAAARARPVQEVQAEGLPRRARDEAAGWREVGAARTFSTKYATRDAVRRRSAAAADARRRPSVRRREPAAAGAAGRGRDRQAPAHAADERAAWASQRAEAVRRTRRTHVSRGVETDDATAQGARELLLRTSRNRPYPAARPAGRGAPVTEAMDLHIYPGAHGVVEGAARIDTYGQRARQLRRVRTDGGAVKPLIAGEWSLATDNSASTAANDMYLPGTSQARDRGAGLAALRGASMARRPTRRRLPEGTARGASAAEFGQCPTGVQWRQPESMPTAPRTRQAHPSTGHGRCGGPRAARGAATPSPGPARAPSCGHPGTACRFFRAPHKHRVRGQLMPAWQNVDVAQLNVPPPSRRARASRPAAVEAPPSRAPPRSRATVRLTTPPRE